MRCNSYVINSFCRKNREVIGDVSTNKDEYIVVNHISTELSYLVLQDDIMAHFLRKESGCKIVSFSLFPDRNTDRIDYSYGIEPININSIEICVIDKIFVLLQSLITLIGNKQKKLVNLKYKGIRIGDLVYEYIQGHKVYQGVPNMKKLRLFKDFYYVYECILLVEKILVWVKDKKVKYVVTQEVNVIRGIPAVVLMTKGADIVIADWYRDTLNINVNGNSNDNWKKFLYLKPKIKLDMERVDVITDSNKFVFDLCLQEKKRNDLLKEIGIRKDGFNVFIMLHCFDDSCRSLSVREIYYDYYDWFIDTLQTVSKIKNSNVNWIFKNHPYAKRYHQEKFPKEDFNRYKTGNMYWMDGTIGGSNIIEVADCVVTDVGDAGVEFVAQGIPSLYTGNSFYSEYGIGTKAKNIGEYKYWLKNIINIKKPEKKEMQVAKKLVFAIKNRRVIYDDPLSKFIGEWSNAYVKSMRSRVDNNRVINDFLSILTAENMEKSGYANKAKEIVTEARV